MKAVERKRGRTIALFEFRHGSYLLSVVHGGLQSSSVFLLEVLIGDNTYVSRVAVDDVLALNGSVV